MTDSTMSGERSRRRGRVDVLWIVAVLAVASALVRATMYTHIDVLQGAAQKIYYLHLPAALAAFLAFFITAVSGVLYLWLKDLRLDRLAESSAEVGVVFTTGVLMAGMLWAKPIWGTWWTWDARLTLTLFLWFIYIGYLVLRDAIPDRALKARYSAVLGILGALLIPFIHLSVYLFRTLHPMPILLKPSRPSESPDMLTTSLWSIGAFLLLFAAFLRQRYRLATLRDALDARDVAGEGGGR